MPLINRHTFFHHQLISLSFAVCASVTGVSAVSAFILYSFLWIFLVVQAFFLEPVHFGIWAYLKIECGERKQSHYWKILGLLSAWFLAVTIPWQFLFWGASTSNLLLLFNYVSVAAALSALVCTLGPLAAQDRQAPWFLSALLMPFAVPLFILLWQSSERSAESAPQKMLWAAALLFIALGSVIYPLTSSTVDE